jgi:hypothetical protein
MSNIPIEKHRLPVNLIEQLEHKIAQGVSVSGDELLDAIEWSQGHQLDDRVRDVITKFSILAGKRRGRPPSTCADRGREDFAMEEVEERYPALLEKYEDEVKQKRRSAAADGTVLPSAEATPSELAYQEILKVMEADFQNIDWRTLRNNHSAWSNGHSHSPENHVDSNDFDAEIDQLFPAPKPRS